MRYPLKPSTTVIIVIAVVDAILITVLVMRYMAQSFDGATSPTATDRVEVSAKVSSLPDGAGARESADGTSTEATPTPNRSEWIVDALSRTTAVRARTGDCEQGSARLELTRDGGDTWTPMPTPATSVLRVKFVDQSSLWLVGTGQDCEADFFSTDNRGQSWQRSGPTSRAWHVRADKRAEKLHGPDGNVPLPCAPDVAMIDLTGVTTSVGYVLCADGDLHRTTDAGADWRQVNTLPGAQAAAFPWPDTGYAAVRSRDGCNGVSLLRTDDAGQTWKPTGCVSGVARVSSTHAGTGLALSLTEEGAGVLLAGTSSWWTSDGGQTWTSAP